MLTPDWFCYRTITVIVVQPFSFCDNASAGQLLSTSGQYHGAELPSTPHQRCPNPRCHHVRSGEGINARSGVEIISSTNYRIENYCRRTRPCTTRTGDGVGTNNRVLPKTSILRRRLDTFRRTILPVEPTVSTITVSDPSQYVVEGCCMWSLRPENSRWLRSWRTVGFNRITSAIAPNCSSMSARLFQSFRDVWWACVICGYVLISGEALKIKPPSTTRPRAKQRSCRFLLRRGHNGHVSVHFMVCVAVILYKFSDSVTNSGSPTVLGRLKVDAPSLERPTSLTPTTPPMSKPRVAARQGSSDHHQVEPMTAAEASVLLSPT